MITAISLLTEDKSLSLKPIINVNLPTQFCLESISHGSGATDSREVS